MMNSNFFIKAFNVKKGTVILFIATLAVFFFLKTKEVSRLLRDPTLTNLSKTQLWLLAVVAILGLIAWLANQDKLISSQTWKKLMYLLFAFFFQVIAATSIVGLILAALLGRHLEWWFILLVSGSAGGIFLVSDILRTMAKKE